MKRRILNEVNDCMSFELDVPKAKERKRKRLEDSSVSRVSSLSGKDACLQPSFNEIDRERLNA